jgi:recombination protein RecA
MTEKPVKKYSTKLDKIIADIDKEFGKGGLVTKIAGIWAPEPFNKTLGGRPRGIVELYGPDGSGKTTFMLHTIAKLQSDGLRCAFIDAESSLDETLMKTIGIDIDKLIIREEQVMEDALAQIGKLLSSSEVGLVVLDSLSGLLTKNMDENMSEKEDYTKQYIADRARAFSNALPEFTKLCRKNKNTLVIINQVREKIGIMFGNPETTPGGRAIKHAAMQRIVIRAIEKIKEGTNVIGKKVKLLAVKNKIANPEVVCEMNLIFGRGFVE